jgi:NADH-quinone oxidoreductase subunit J
MEMELHLFFLIVTLLIPMILAVFAADLIRSVIALLVGSVGLTLILFNLGSPIAGIFELSVGAGLISVLFILSISLIRPLSKETQTERQKKHYRRFFVLPFIILILAVLFYLNREQWMSAFTLNSLQENTTVGKVLWETRGLDLIGQIGILLVGVFGVVVLFKRGKMNE